MSSVPMCCPGNRYQTPPEVVRLHQPSARHPQASRRHASPLFSAPFTSTRPPPTCSPASGARADAGGAVAPHRHSCIDGSRLDTVILQCHCLSFLRGVHSNLPVIAVICSQNDRVAPDYASETRGVVSGVMVVPPSARLRPRGVRLEVAHRRRRRRSSPSPREMQLRTAASLRWSYLCPWPCPWLAVLSSACQSTGLSAPRGRGRRHQPLRLRGQLGRRVLRHRQDPAGHDMPGQPNVRASRRAR
jgi:hypothetical protein